MTHQPVSHEMWFARFDAYLHQQGYRAQTVHRYRAVCRQFLSISRSAISPWSRWTLPPWRRTFSASNSAMSSGMGARHPMRPICSTGVLPCSCAWSTGTGPHPPTDSPQEQFQQQVCAGYAQWLARCRGLAPRTIAIRQARGQKFLAWLGARGTPDGLRDLAVADLDAYFAAQAPRLRRSTRADLTCGLRDFLRYLYAHGLIAQDLAPTVLSPTLYAFERLPAALTPEEVQAVLASARQERTPIGCAQLCDPAALGHLRSPGRRSGPPPAGGYRLAPRVLCTCGRARRAAPPSCPCSRLWAKRSWRTSVRDAPPRRPGRCFCAPRPLCNPSARAQVSTLLSPDGWPKPVFSPPGSAGRIPYATPAP